MAMTALRNWSRDSNTNEGDYIMIVHYKTSSTLSANHVISTTS